MSIVGVLTFFSLNTMLIIKKLKTMVNIITFLVVGVALAGRKEPCSIL